MVSNDFNVPKRQWKKWSEEQQQRFNDLYSFMKKDQFVFSHPEGPILHNKHWNTIAWNAAFMAAEF